MLERFEHFTTLTSRIRRSIRKIKTEEMAEFDLKTPHLFSLYLLYKNGSLTPKELSELCKEDKGSISRSIEQLEKFELVSADTSKHKKYKTPLTLTEKGKRITKKLVKKMDEIIEEAGDGISDEDRAIFYKTLSKLNKNLETICKKYEEPDELPRGGEFA